MVVIGSRALNEYIPIGRIMHDWDVICFKEEFEYIEEICKSFLVKKTDYSFTYDINGTIVEVRNSNSLLYTDLILLDSNSKSMKTPIGEAFVPTIQKLYDLKVATYTHIPEHKHEYDIELIKNNFVIENDTPLYRMRHYEIGKRIEASTKVKYEFFHKYHIPEYIVHDRLHTMFSDLLEISIPTYQRITSGDVEVSEELFNNLTHDQKIDLMVEESLVLALERWFIPQMVEHGINYRILDAFYNNNEAMPTYLILQHCCLTGLKGEKEYIVDFARGNFFEIEKKWQKAKSIIKTKKGFPKWFYDELFILRDKYKSGSVEVII